VTVGRFDLVAQLASELKERRLARTRPPEHESLRIRQRDGGGSTAPQQDHLSPPRDEPREEDQNHALVPRKVATPGRQRSNDELLTQEGVLGNEFLARAGCVEKRPATIGIERVAVRTAAAILTGTWVGAARTRRMSGEHDPLTILDTPKPNVHRRRE
jgi:hypothetical protein